MDAQQRRLEKLGIDSSNRLFEVITVACQKQNLDPEETQLIRIISDNMILMSGKSFRPDTPSSARCAFVLANRQRIQDVYKGLSTKLQLSPKDLEDLNKADIASKPIMIRTMLQLRNIGYTKILVATILAAASLFALYVSGGIIYNMYAAVSGTYHLAKMPLVTLYSLLTNGTYWISFLTILAALGVIITQEAYTPLKMAELATKIASFTYRGVKNLMALTLKGVYHGLQYALYTVVGVTKAIAAETAGTTRDVLRYGWRNWGNPYTRSDTPEEPGLRRLSETPYREPYVPYRVTSPRPKPTVSTSTEEKGAGLQLWSDPLQEEIPNPPTL